MHHTQESHQNKEM